MFIVQLTSNRPTCVSISIMRSTHASDSSRTAHLYTKLNFQHTAISRKIVLDFMQHSARFYYWKRLPRPGRNLLYTPACAFFMLFATRFQTTSTWNRKQQRRCRVRDAE